ncbi:MAG: orotidine-5'-phosphate decarboxylase [Candidatus Syntrophoarchaeum sp. WYZ-LMO15]|nr:MAG: orotidine-5'-phosphate decarboxylase [Candidatus Syntrophoarchaeum sp. WYZ-LMO15]
MPALKREPGIIVAFDMEEIPLAIDLAESLEFAKGNFAIKIGRPFELQLGLHAIERIRMATSHPIIYDGKIADIPHISEKIARIAYRAGADAVIVHAFVGRDVMEAIVDLRMGDVIAIVDMSHPGSSNYMEELSARIARDLGDIGIDGVVLPATKPERIERLKELLPDDVYVISPGIGAQGMMVGDAIVAGADYEIVGRAIVEADDPARAASRIYDEMIERWRRSSSLGTQQDRSSSPL